MHIESMFDRHDEGVLVRFTEKAAKSPSGFAEPNVRHPQVPRIKKAGTTCAVSKALATHLIKHGYAEDPDRTDLDSHEEFKDELDRQEEEEDAKQRRRGRKVRKSAPKGAMTSADLTGGE